MTPNVIGILHHPKKPKSLELAKAIELFVRKHGQDEIWHESAWQTDTVLARIPDCSLLITLGGDGTLLRAARMGAPYGVPMLGVKLGRLGFLAEVEPDDWEEPLKRVLEGDFWLEKRLMVRARVERPLSNIETPEPADATDSSSIRTDNQAGRWPIVDHPDGQRAIICEYDALNDVVVSRGDLARVVRIDLELDGGYLTQYTCDGLIVSTATGSTGYALAVGGPVLPPDLHNILVLPIAPHLSMDRAVVLSEGAIIRMRAFSDHTAMLTVDGQFVVEVQNGDEVVVVSSPHTASFIRLRSRSYFYQALMDKLRWAG